MEFSEILEELVSRSKLTKKEICKRCDISDGHLSDMLSGNKLPTYKTLKKIAIGLDADANVLLGLKELN